MPPRKRSLPRPVQGELFERAPPNPPGPKYLFRLTMDAVVGGIVIEWRQPQDTAPAAKGILTSHPERHLGVFVLHWTFQMGSVIETRACSDAAPAVTELWLSIISRLPLAANPAEMFMILNEPVGAYDAHYPYELDPPPRKEGLRAAVALIQRFAEIIAAHRTTSNTDPSGFARTQVHALITRSVPGVVPKLAPARTGLSGFPSESISSEYRGPSPATQREYLEIQRLQQNIRRAQLSQARQARQTRPPKSETKPAAKPAPRPTAPSVSPGPAPAAKAPTPPVPLKVEVPDLALQESAFPIPNLADYLRRERALQWWVSNQSDDLLCLSHCRIQHLDYQVRSALRILGPLRGRALLSDEVGLGKTIEAGLVLKEWLTRGMVRRFLVLTVPSLVDQWQEELSEKFELQTSTTNGTAFRSDPAAFWTENSGIVASLATLKLAAHLDVARTVKWDLVIVDEAHYLRNRDSLSWQAVNSLPRQFLLLLTATPVQNSLEELYNLVTLLQPGQLPSPKEFRARFMDPKKPRSPKEPEELRRLLGQVMIRNTRANAGVQLPPRHAETVVFESTPDEQAFWTEWETGFRGELASLGASQSSLWGRLLLQAAGSSPAAWLQALEKFPNRAFAQSWKSRACLDVSWRRKLDLVRPLARAEGGLVIFTQFLATQEALGLGLEKDRIPTFLIHGGVPAAQRQPITERFRKEGGVLILTHSGTEGRNLQFCHQLVNFDLPWNPMEIEQRIGRLHRLGQKQPVRIFNLVQLGTLQAHLLEILQEKLNLFELVVGETGLVLGERFSSDEFAEEILRRWRDSDGRVAEALQSLGNDLASARDQYQQLKHLDETLFAKDYETL